MIDKIMQTNERLIESLKDSNAGITRLRSALTARDEAIRVAEDAITQLLPFAEDAFPERDHDSCTPETNCDGICVEAADISGTIRLGHRALSALAAAKVQA